MGIGASFCQERISDLFPTLRGPRPTLGPADAPTVEPPPTTIPVKPEQPTTPQTPPPAPAPDINPGEAPAPCPGPCHF